MLASRISTSTIMSNKMPGSLLWSFLKSSLRCELLLLLLLLLLLTKYVASFQRRSRKVPWGTPEWNCRNFLARLLIVCFLAGLLACLLAYLLVYYFSVDYFALLCFALLFLCCCWFLLACLLRFIQDRWWREGRRGFSRGGPHRVRMLFPFLFLRVAFPSLYLGLV